MQNTYKELTLFSSFLEFPQRVPQAFRQIIPSKWHGVVVDGQNKNGPRHQEVTKVSRRSRRTTLNAHTQDKSVGLCWTVKIFFFYT